MLHFQPSKTRVRCVSPANRRARHSDDVDPTLDKRGKRKKTSVLGRTRRTRLFHPVICIAANRFSNRFHVRDSGVYPPGVAHPNSSNQDKFMCAANTEINPTKITACRGYLMTRETLKFVTLEEALQHPDWCEECREIVQRIVNTRKIQAELGTNKPQRKGWR